NVALFRLSHFDGVLNQTENVVRSRTGTNCVKVRTVQNHNGLAECGYGACIHGRASNFVQLVSDLLRHQVEVVLAVHNPTHDTCRTIPELRESMDHSGMIQRGHAVTRSVVLQRGTRALNSRTHCTDCEINVVDGNSGTALLTQHIAELFRRDTDLAECIAGLSDRTQPTVDLHADHFCGAQ